jgi:hypothetical protein
MSLALGLAAALASATLPVNGDMTNAVPAAPKTPPPAATNPPGKPAVLPVPQDYFQPYGKILAPGTEPTHPLKLAMPGPDFGQVKVPSQEELSMREKLEGLADLSDEDIRINLYKWPAFTKMNLADEGAMLMRIQMFRDRRAHIAQDKARALGLVTLKPDQMARFEKEYWDRRLQMDRELAKQFEPIFKDREAKIGEELFREFSLPAHPVPPPPAPAVAQNGKPAPPAPMAPTHPAPPAPGAPVH